jgi:hypothetical protein
MGAVISFVLAAILATLAAAVVIVSFVHPVYGLPASVIAAITLAAPTTLFVLPLTALVLPKRNLYRYLILPAVGALAPAIVAWTGVTSVNWHGDFKLKNLVDYLLAGGIPGAVGGLMFARALAEYSDELPELPQQTKGIS